MKTTKTITIFFVSLFLLIVGNSNLYAQIHFMDTKVSDNLSQKEHWENLKIWVSDNFDDYGTTIDYINPSTGKMIIKGKAPIRLSNSAEHFGGVSFYATFSLEVNCEDNGYNAAFRNASCGYRVSYADYSYLSKSILDMTYNDLNAIRKISIRNGEVWNIDDSFYAEQERLEKKYTEAKEKSEDMALKKKERKANEKIYKECEAEYRMYSSAISTMSSFRYSLFKSLENAMSNARK